MKFLNKEEAELLLGFKSSIEDKIRHLSTLDRSNGADKLIDAQIYGYKFILEEINMYIEQLADRELEIKLGNNG